MAEPTIAAGYACALMALAVSKGADPRMLTDRSGLDPDTLQDQDRRIPFANYVALMRVGQELCNDPALALHFARTCSVLRYRRMMSSAFDIFCSKVGS
jgi:hypothetical protein